MAFQIYVVGSAFLYSLFLISLVDNVLSPNIVHFTTWVVALGGELILFGVSAALYTSPHNEINSIKGGGRYTGPATQWEIIELICDATRILLLVLCIGLYLIFSIQRTPSSVSNSPRSSSPESGTPANERTPLLNGHAHGTVHGTLPIGANGAPIRNGSTAGSDATAGHDAHTEHINGNTNGAVRGPSAPADSAAFYRPTTAEARSWWEYLRGYSLFFPYLWPSASLRLQLIVIVCFSIVLLQRLMNLLVPYQIGVVTDRLAGDGENGTREMPWLQISLLIVYKLVQGSSGLLGAARSVLWIPVAQYSYAALSTASFEHVHGLSLEFHLGKRTGEVLSALSKGAAINVFLEQVTFQVLPMLIDLGVAIAYFAVAFDAYYSLTVSVLTFWYLYLTIRLAQWRAEARRQMINADREEDAVKNDSIQSYETVKYFGAEDYEFERYRNAVRVFQKAEYKVTLSLQVMNITQNMVFMLGLLVVSFIAAYQVTTNQRPVGQFVTLITYMAQLQGPLNYFGTFYRSVQSAMISGERLLELFKEQPTVVDEPGSKDMPRCEGQIRFENVKFSYDERKPALEGLSFTCPPGTTTALVGESGGGKSTVFRLLFRFYNFQEGSIQLDGHDVRDVTIKALRSHIGVVPQDTILFNETLIYNLRYANQNATDEEIYAACRAASIHDKIMTFPDGYQTKVGERGLRLSGGEKQRVAIARTILKNPRIIMLDEATAALDSETEQNIQEALKTLSEGRTMLVIA
jgi:ATP-binding cassette, subfamily B, vacuolar membrane transporter HMT1/ACLQ